ncbi:MAG: cytochrome-c peroxidase [Gemmatimonadales bacterium]
MKAIWYTIAAAVAAGASPAPQMLAPRAFVTGTPVHVDLRQLAPIRQLGPATITVRFPRDAAGLRAADAVISGIPLTPAVLHATVIVITRAGQRVTFRWPIVIFAAGLPRPEFPDTLLPYSDFRVATPRHFLADVTGSAFAEDNSPRDNRVTDAGATLGRVLFYDSRLSANDRISCASCHQQKFGFADTARFSRGIGGTLTRRHTMSLANARYYRNARFFRDERAATLEAQVLQPVADHGEMGLALDAMELKLRLTPYYAALFRAAFGTPEINRKRVSLALAQFVRALVSNRARLDSLYRGGGPPDLAMLTREEREGRALFIGRAGCARCHRTTALELDLPDNIGLDSMPADSGAGSGRFKVSSLRNVAVRPPYMHDGRFNTLDDVVAFYDSGIQPDPNLDLRLRQPDGSPQRLHLTVDQRAAIVAYLGTFTDQDFLHDARFGNPFRRP